MEEINNYSVNELIFLRESIEKMNKFNQIEILKILKKYKSIILNENKYGIHINLTELPQDILLELSTYVNYVCIQENVLNDDERKKEDYRNTYFSKLKTN